MLQRRPRYLCISTDSEVVSFCTAYYMVRCLFASLDRSVSTAIDESSRRCRTIAAINVAILLAIVIITPARILQFVQDLSGWLRDQGSFGAFLLFMATGELHSALHRPTLAWS